MQTVRTNLANNAPAQYTNFDFNSLCRFNGKIFAAGAKGLFIINTGDDDNGTDIDAEFTLMKSDFGFKGEKRLRYIHCGFDGDGDIACSVTLEDGTPSADLVFDYDSTKGQQTHRVEPPRDLGKFVHGELTIKNVDGSDFEISKIDAEYYKLARGRN